MLRRAAPLAALVLLLTACSPTSTPGVGLPVGPTTADRATPPAAGPGAPGVGDPYFPLDGNGGYDVQDYALAVDYEPTTDALAGTATIRARAAQALPQFHLDLRGLEVVDVTVDGAAARHERIGEELVVTPAVAVAEGAEFTTAVRYAGVPETIEDTFGISGFLHTDDGALVVGQPDVAATWFPVNDHPSDPATYTIAVTVPEGVTAVANGVLEGSTTDAGRTTWTWRADQPMASYLAGLGIGDFELTAYEAGGIRFWDAFDLDVDGLPIARASLGRQPQVLEYLASVFGPYPFTAAGGIVDDVPELGFALENQTRPIYSPAFFTDAVSGDTVVVHELAHQWFGDSRPLARWSDIWLNEGFASYAEWLWDEREGRGTAQERFAAETGGRPAADPFWTVRIGDPGPEALFDEAVYIRGAMTVHALRTTIGDDAFFRLLPRWTERATQPSSTAEFVALAEEVSGQQLDELFTTWLDTPTKPAS